MIESQVPTYEWYVARIMPRNVNRAQRELIGKALMYSPMRKVIYKVRGASRSSMWPALPGYVLLFAPHDPASWYAIRETYGVQEILTPVGEPKIGKPWCCPVEDIDHLRSLELRGEWDEMKEYLQEIIRQPRRRRRPRKTKAVERKAAA